MTNGIVVMAFEVVVDWLVIVLSVEVELCVWLIFVVSWVDCEEYVFMLV